MFKTKVKQPPTKEENDQGLAIGVFRTQSLEASVTKACSYCQAPGLYGDHPSLIEKWPKCYRPAWKGRSVGEICPQCGNKRTGDIGLGEIWRKDFMTRIPYLKLIKALDSIVGFFRRK